MVKPAANTPLAVPGLAEAMEREKITRDADFLNVSTTVEGFELVPLTLYHLCLLRIAKSPFVIGGTPSPEQLTAFLWVMSPEFEPLPHSLARARIMKQCHAFIPPALPWLHTRRAMSKYKRLSEARLILATKLVIGCRQFIHETFEDSPPRPATVTFRPDYYSSSTSFCAALAREFGWSENEVLHMPMRRVLQYLNEAREHNDPKAILFNPSDRVTRDWLISQNKTN